MSYIKLSPRMQVIADMTDKRNVADIGCDHAFVSIYLIQKGKADKVIATDIRKGPISIARNNIDMYGLTTSIDTRLSDGFDKIAVGEIEQAIISGMGGELIIDILKRGKAQLEYGIDLILQPQSEPEKLRKYLLDTGYIITDEKMLVDDGKYYVVMKAVPYIAQSSLDNLIEIIRQNDNDSEFTDYSDVELLYGKILISKKDAVLKEYLLMQLHKNNELIEKLSSVKTDNSMNKVIELKEDIKKIKETLECL